MRRRGSVRPLCVLASAVTIGLACNSPSAVVTPPLEVVIASGDGQYGTAGQTLGRPLRVVVRTLTGQVPQEGTGVLWEVVAGAAELVGVQTTTTDSTGATEIRLRLGNETGPVSVRAAAQDTNNPSITFEAFTVDRPQLTDVTPTTAAPGTTVTLTGANFSPDPTQNVVLFSGIRGRVTSASESQAVVEVPSCLPARPVDVSLQLGVVASGTRPLTVGPGGTVESLAVGDVRDVSDDEGFACLTLPGNGAEYLALVYSTSTVGAATHPYRLGGVSSSPPPAMAAGARVRWPRSQVESDADVQADLDRRLRALEDEWVTASGRPRSVAPSRAPALNVPAVGQSRRFSVFDSEGSFADVRATARWVGQEVVLYVDDDAPVGGFIPADLESLADAFDAVIHPVVTGAFGATSDLDGNERVAILFTPVVNSLTPRGSSGFVGGFFFGIDLLPERDGSNEGEVFYALVPDPSGIHSDARSREAVLDITPGILSHEFQHMVHFNERMLVREAGSTEAVWLSEGLAQYAEELVGLEYDRLQRPDDAEQVRSGARVRARRYLAATDTVSLIISVGQGSLAERGAGFLFTMYLADRFGADVVGRLTRSTRVGVANVEVETGQSWAGVSGDWWSAVYRDAGGVEPGPRVYPTVDLRSYIGNPFPLEVVEVGVGDFTLDASLWSSAAEYYIVAPPPGGALAVRVSGEAGGVSSSHAEVRMRVIRIS